MPDSKYKIGDRLVYTFTSSHYPRCKSSDGLTGSVIEIDGRRDAGDLYLIKFPNGEKWWCDESSLSKGLIIGCKVMINIRDTEDDIKYNGLVGLIEEIITESGYPYRVRPLNRSSSDLFISAMEDGLIGFEDGLIGFREDELDLIQRDIKVTLTRRESKDGPT